MSYPQMQYDWVLLRNLEVEKVSAGGIVLEGDRMVGEAEVLSVGPGKMNGMGMVVPVPWSVGDVVLAHKLVGTELFYGGERLRIASADNIFALIPKE